MSRIVPAGAHAAPRQHSPIRAAALMVSVPCEGLLALAWLRRVTPKLARLAGSGIVTAASWLLLVGVCVSAGFTVAGATEPREPGVHADIAATIACVSALVLLEAGRAAVRAQGRRRWRETGGRMTPTGPMTAAERAHHLARIDKNCERIDVLEGQITALVAALAAAYEVAGEPAPATRPQERHLHLAKGDTEPLPSAG